MMHPFHPQHPLTLTIRDLKTQMIADYNAKSYTSYTPFLDLNWFQADIIFDKCSWCEGSITIGATKSKFMIFYRCSICNYCLDLPCSKSNPPLTIQNPESHHHPLVLFARPLTFPCDACGLICRSEPSYACYQCNYMVHESCITLPRVIKITRHPHRLFHTPYLPPKIWLCRICYKTVDAKYGHYSCKNEDCSYIVHSKCATDKEVWDGRELEWEPEEPEEDISSFKSLGDDLIKHFCHDHNLKLEKYNGGQCIIKICQVCILPINLKNFYNCLQCDYLLHEVCANLPRKLDHALHKHSLVLDPSPMTDYESMDCSVCLRRYCGFRYKCSTKDCSATFGQMKNVGVNQKMFGRAGCQINIDVRCSLVLDYFTHKSHEHPLFISTSNSHKDFMCKGCKKEGKQSHIKCTQCEYALCYKCVTIPAELYYKHDEHLLSLCYGEDKNDNYWCEVCEKQLDPTSWFYTCNKCCITIHQKCVFGSSIYMKSDIKFKYHSKTVESFRSDSSCTRPICSYCDNRCVGFMYYKWIEKSFCSLRCVDYAAIFTMREYAI